MPKPSNACLLTHGARAIVCGALIIFATPLPTAWQNPETEEAQTENVRPGFSYITSGRSRSRKGSPLIPFTAQLVEKHFRSAMDTAPIAAEHISFARRSDGSEANYRTLKSPDGKQFGQLGGIIDLGRAVSISIEPFTRSATTMDERLDVLKYRLEANGCPADVDKLGEHAKMLGYEVVKIHECDHPHCDTEFVDTWVAPELGCFALAETDATRGAPNVKTVISVTKGEPSPAMFVVPSDYVERSPSQLSAAWEAKFGQKFWPDDKIRKRLDYRYYAHRCKPALSEAWAVTAVAFNAGLASPTTPAASSQCVPSPVFTPEAKTPHLKPGTVVGEPVLELQVGDDGGVKDVRLIRSSKIKDWDKEILKTMRTWRFAKAPGCGCRKIGVSINIHVY